MCKWINKGFVFLSFISLVLYCFPLSTMSYDFKLWKNLGIYGGTIYDIAIDPGDPNRVFAGSFMGDGVFLTEDEGSNWHPVEASNGSFREDTFKNHAVYAVKIAPGYPNIVWVAHDFWVEKSMDGGQTWTHISNSKIQLSCINCGSESDVLRICRSLVIDPIDPNIVYVGTSGPNRSYSSGTIYKTGDEGLTWEKIGFIESNMEKTPDEFDYMVMDMDIDPQDPNIIWAVTNSAGDEVENEGSGTMYRSGDSGGTWEKIFPGNDSQSSSGFYSVVVKPNDSNIVFTGSGSGIRKHYREENEWTSELVQISENCLVRDITFDPQYPDTIYTTWKDPRSEDSFPKFAISTNGGDEWDANTIELVDPNKGGFLSEFLTLAVHPSNREIIFGGELNLGVFKSKDRGQTWAPINNGINAMIVNDVVIDPNDSTHILTGTHCGIYQKKQNKDWSHLTQKETSVVAFHPTNIQIFYAGVEGRLGKTTDGGKNWIYSKILDNGKNYISSIAIDPADPNTLFISVAGNGVYGRIYKSTGQNLDGGDWFGEPVLSSNYNFNVVLIDPSDSNHIFAGDGCYYDTNIFLGNLYESKMGGGSGTWDPNRLTNVIVNTVLIDPEDTNTIYVGCSDGMDKKITLYRTEDGGDEWESSCKDMHREYLLKSDDNTLTQVETRQSSDHSHSHDKRWPTGEFGRVTRSSVTDLAFHPKDKNVIYASTMTNGIYFSTDRGSSWHELGTLPYYVYGIAVGSVLGASTGLWAAEYFFTGYVKDACTKKGIEMAEIVATSTSTQYSANTDCNGLFSISHVIKGEYNITVTAVSYIDNTINELNIASTVPIFSLEDHIWMESNDPPIIQPQIIAADNEETITIGPGIYCENIDFMGKTITLKSEDPNDPNVVASTIIDGRMQGSVVNFGEGSNSTLSGFTLQNGQNKNGGGIYCNSLSSPLISNCIIKTNYAEKLGGGIYGDNSMPRIVNTKLMKNNSLETLKPSQICINDNSVILCDMQIVDRGINEKVCVQRYNHNTGKWEPYYRFFGKQCNLNNTVQCVKCLFISFFP